MAAAEALRKRIVVTGVSSFIGSRLARRLAEKGFAVTGTISRPLWTYNEISNRRLAYVQSAGVTLKKLDITDTSQVLRFISTERPYAWVQNSMEAESAARRDYQLLERHRLNVAPLGFLYESLKRFDCQGVVVTGSGEEYSMLPSLCFEEDSCWPLTPHGLSKLTETMRAFQLAQKFELPTRVARVFLPYGPMDSLGNIIPSTIKVLSEQKGIDLPPCLEQRDFLYIDDLADGYLRLISDLRNRQSLFDVFNLCGGQGVSLRKVLIILAKLLQSDIKLLRFGRLPAASGEISFHAGANDKAKALLQWNPRSLEVGLISYLQEEGLL